MKEEIEVEEGEEETEEEARIIKGLDGGEKSIWRQLNNQFILNNRQFVKSLEEYRDFMNKHEGLKSLEIYFVVERVIDNFGELLSVSEGEKSFLFKILAKKEKIINKIDENYQKKTEDTEKELKKVKEELENKKKQINNLLNNIEVKKAQENAEKVEQQPLLHAQIKDLQSKIKDQEAEKKEIRISQKDFEIYEDIKKIPKIPYKILKKKYGYKTEHSIANVKRKVETYYKKQENEGKEQRF